MNSILSVQFTTFSSITDLNDWKMIAFGTSDEYDRWSRTIHVSLSLIVDSFLVSKVALRDGYKLSGGFLAYDPVSSDENLLHRPLRGSGALR